MANSLGRAPASQQQIGHIDAGNQHQQPDRREQNQQASRTSRTMNTRSPQTCTPA